MRHFPSWPNDYNKRYNISLDRFQGDVFIGGRSSPRCSYMHRYGAGNGMFGAIGGGERGGCHQGGYPPMLLGDDHSSSGSSTQFSGRIYPGDEDSGFF